MSLKNQLKQNCPHCNTEQILTFYNTVNITIDPSLKDRVLNGNLNSQLCSNCKKEINVMGDFLYHDMKNQLMINLKENIAIEEIEESEMLQDLKDKGYIYRHVHSYPELIEKIKIFDQKLNDEVVEKIKSEILTTLSTSLQEAVEDVEDAMIHFFFEKLEKSMFKKKLLFVFFLHPEELMAINYNIKKLNKIDRKQLFDIDILRVSK